MDETYIKVKGIWKYLYRAVDKQGKTVDFLLTAKRDKAAAMRFFDKAMQTNGVPAKVTMDKSGANKAAIDEIKAGSGTPIMVRQVKYLNNIVEQDHRAAKRVTKPMLNFKSFQSVANATKPLGLSLNAARAVNFNTHARDKGGFVAGQVQRGIGHVKRGGKAAQRNRGQEFVSARIVQRTAGKLGGQAGVGVEHRIDAVHANVVRAQLCCE